MAHVLVIDDDRDLAALASIRLKKAGHDVHSVYDGESGLARIRDTRPHIVILDWMMPGMDGIDVCQAVRADLTIAATPLVMLTAKATIADHQTALAAGVDAVVSKPYLTAELVDCIRSILGTHLI
jgi:DNA-binding response OmpR family regulator